MLYFDMPMSVNYGGRTTSMDRHQRARNHGIELAGEIGKVEMAVAVD
jgi:hypothetical protein